MNPVRGLLFDLDGVFHVGDELLPGAVETITMLRARRIPFRIVTNTTTLSRASLVRRMRGLGLPLDAGDVINAPYAAVHYLRALASPRCRFIMTEDAKSEFAEFENVETDPDYIVLGDIEDQVSYPLLNSIFNQMMAGSELIALHRGRYWQAGTGLKVDLGLFVSGLEYTTGNAATVIGKPSRAIFEIALNELGLPAAECAMIGDDIVNDVGGAQAAGIRGVLITTGKYRADRDTHVSRHPDVVIDSLFEVDRLLE